MQILDVVCKIEDMVVGCRRWMQDASIQHSECGMQVVRCF